MGYSCAGAGAALQSEGIVAAPSHRSRPAAGLQPGDARAYFLCQLAGWGAYGAAIYFMSAGRGSSGAVAGTALWCGCGMLGTHLLRTYSRRHPWHTIPQLLPRLACAVLLIPLAMIGVQLSTRPLLEGPQAHDAPGWVVVAHFFQAFIVVTLWCALYFGAHEIRRRRAAEMEALRLALEAQVAQFHTLRAQLNPHFLFNCLNSLRELIDEDRGRAQQVVTQLSELLRYTLQADRVDTVSLKEELRAVEDYLSLEKLRFEERLRLRYDVAPEVLAAKVPPMLVQTLAENGLKHGIAKLPAGGELSIATRVAPGSLQIEVTNTGSLGAANGPPGVGLQNARERLRLVYGENAWLTLRAAGPGTVQATVTIPFSAEPGP